MKWKWSKWKESEANEMKVKEIKNEMKEDMKLN